MAVKTNKETKVNYIKVEEANEGTSASVKETMLWLKPANFGSTSVTIDVGNDDAISGFVKAIRLKNVDVSIVKNKNGYPEILIEG